ncbi:Oidioi.mRNA.OKI2018_I69.chr2.g4826.t1.cds [Oikopleura dioica]|uniref:Oidioi.mRNA.OKI2018_I69.chr2.g4826.t1.cds n=1 Tax=Oikopleura dioica TaxID=34765 RepID=A0ABN7SYL8_OIKDI|nr:Oidioi.mRNA.OKI2018_I69.chr2.g4826.t1.cds [Oikopleura dioica]
MDNQNQNTNQTNQPTNNFPFEEKSTSDDQPSRSWKTERSNTNEDYENGDDNVFDTDQAALDEFMSVSLTDQGNRSDDESMETDLFIDEEPDESHAESDAMSITSLETMPGTPCRDELDPSALQDDCSPGEVIIEQPNPPNTPVETAFKTNGSDPTDLRRDFDRQVRRNLGKLEVTYTHNERGQRRCPVQCGSVAHLNCQNNRKRNFEGNRVNQAYATSRPHAGTGQASYRTAIGSKFNNDRNRWLKQEKLKPHQRMPYKYSPSEITVYPKKMSGVSKRDLDKALKANDWRKIRSALSDIANNRECLSTYMIKRLNRQVELAIYKGGLPLKITDPLPLKCLPRFFRASITATYLCDPGLLLRYFNFPSASYKLNRISNAEILWKRLGQRDSIKYYRLAFAQGARLVERIQ